MPTWQERGGRPRGRAAPSLRVPLSPKGTALSAPPRATPPSDRPLLRLAVSKGLLGIELDAPFALGPLQIGELALTLPGVRFPVDLSGGVSRFRHRRGAMQRLVVEATTANLMAWAAPRLRGLLGEGTPDLVLAPIEGGVLVGLRCGPAALAFDALIAPLEGDLRLLPERARGMGLGAPPHVLAMRVLGSLLGSLGRALGGAIVLPDAAAQLGRHVLPFAGARAPAADGVRWDPPEADLGGFSLSARADAPPPALSERILRALELAELAGDADETAYAGDLEGARHAYLTLLERAPRHREISQRIAWIDATLGDRAEGALSTLIESLPATDAGILGGQLLAAVGDSDGARTALSRAAHIEPYGPLAAMLWLEVARLEGELDQRLTALEQAVTRAPALDLARWERLSARLDLADIRGARADAEHLEAAARGAEARHAVWRRAADAFLDRGFVAESSALFERALRYAPDNVEAVAGLARAFRAAGQDRRALDLFARAAALAARAGKPAPAVEIELARALADVAGDRPAAVARARAVPPGLPESFEARFLEGRFRAELGDLAGAALAFGRLADAVDLAPPLDEARAAAVAILLREAADIEERELSDLLAAQHLLGLALRQRPRDRGIAAEFRRVAAAVASAAPKEAHRTPEPPEPRASSPRPEPVPRHVVRSAPPLLLGGLRLEDAATADHEDTPRSEMDVDDELLVQELTAKVRADPHDHATAMVLADALTRLGHDLDLLGLLSARMEEGDEDVRREVMPRRREVLERLAHKAHAEGRASEAELYEMLAAADGA